jgi:hypothetical protein
MLETQKRTITNEDESNDFYHLMQRTMYKMREEKTGTGSGGFEWPDSEGQKKSEELFEVRSRPDGLSYADVIVRKGRHATRVPKVGNPCFEAAKCTCVSNELRCTLRCHRGDVGIRCLNY